MGGQRRYSERFFIPVWTSTVAALRFHGAEVTAHCSSCGAVTSVDLARVEAAKGEAFSLWNKAAPCRTPGCGDRVWFKAARPGSGVWPVNMRGAAAVVVARLDAACRARQGEATAD